MKDSYHDKLIQAFCSDLDYITEKIGFTPNEILTNIYFKNGEIDIFLSNGLEKALIEVKESNNKISKFTQKQYKKYREYDKNASVYLVIGTKDQSLEKRDLFIKRYWPISL
jgi:hypothetical protein